MCSHFWKRMENDQGDLADIVRASGGGVVNVNNSVVDWQLPPETMNIQSRTEEPVISFGDPFANLQDPLLHEMDMTSSVIFNESDSTGVVKRNLEDDSIHGQKILDEEMEKPSNVFSKVLQISPTAQLPISPNITNSSVPVASPRGIKRPSLDPNVIIMPNSASCLVDNGSLQIPLPRTSGMKRRKNQTKKVVCIPAPAAANNKPGGEVVPSDHWAWRKYGQKPIKGSPYPRGYYRCSSSKGCSARKQVERSRNDPNMLVITYTSEHNHPWPTQRNALAGATRTQPVKKETATKGSPSTHTPKPTNLKEEHIEGDNDNPSAVGGKSSSTTPRTGKEMEKSMMEMPSCEFDSNNSDDYFTYLGELETDAVDLMFTQGVFGGQAKEDRENKDLDPFSLFDWSENSFGETGKGL